MKIGKILSHTYSFACVLFKVKTISNNIYAGKRVAVIGPAIDPNDISLVDKINSFDLVVHVNKTPLMKSKTKDAAPLKVDHLFRSYNRFTINEKESDDLDGLADFSIACGKAIELRKKAKIYFRNGGKKYIWIGKASCYKKLLGVLGGKAPSTGMCALWFVLNSAAKEVFVSGFTFYQHEVGSRKPYGEGYRGNADELEDVRSMISIKHDCDSEFQIFKDLKDKCWPIVSVDKRLAEILKGHR